MNPLIVIYTDAYDTVSILREILRNTKFICPDEYEGHLEGVLISNQEIVERTSGLAKAIREEYKATNTPIVLLNVLKGSSVVCLSAVPSNAQSF